MKSFILIAALLFGASVAVPQGEPPRRPVTVAPGELPQPDGQPLNEEQRKLVKTILSRYTESALTADDARAINEAFRAGGLRGGPGLQQAIIDAGFNARRISALAPPPDQTGSAKPERRELFQLDGLLSYQRAAVLGDIITHLDANQKAYLGKMMFSDSRTWPNLGDQIDKRSLSHDRHVAVMTYASELFSWYAGSVEADVYFCPERHATYFGSFYMKDIPAMGNPSFSISNRGSVPARHRPRGSPARTPEQHRQSQARDFCRAAAFHEGRGSRQADCALPVTTIR